MSTRGAFGFYKNGVDKIMYNHFDSYPGGLGINILTGLRNLKLQEGDNPVVDSLNKAFDLMNAYKVDKERKIIGEQPQGIEIKDVEEDEVFLKILNGESFYFRDAKDFIQDSVFCEWAYIINLDTEELEIYSGFNKEAQEGNRYFEGFKEIPNDNLDHWQPCWLLCKFLLCDLPSDDIFKKVIDKAERKKDPEDYNDIEEEEE